MKPLFITLFFIITGLFSALAQRNDKLDSHSKLSVSGELKSLEAKFTADKTQGISPLAVQFTDQSTGNPTTWKWYFGDGDSSMVQSPLHTYSSVGKYDVKLLISDGSTAYALEKKEYINVVYNVSQCDTLHSPLPEPLTYYAIAGGKGYVSGNNIYGDKAIGDYFENMEPNLMISGVLLDFAKAKKAGNTDEKIPVCVWATNSSTGAPGNLIASDSINLSQLVTDVAGNKISSFEFTNHISMGASFFMGIELPKITGDTLCFWSTAQGKVPVNTGWVLTKDQGWKSAKELWSQGSTNFIITNAIYPKVCKVNGISERPEALSYYVYPNPANEMITIVCQNEKRSSNAYMITDISGKAVLNGKTNASLATPVNISSLAPGIYILRISELNNIFVTKLIVR